MLFDTHAHVLSADRVRYPFGPLRGGTVPPVDPVIFPVEQLTEHMDACGVARACLVQRATLYGYDNRYALDAAAKFPQRLAPVLVLDAQEHTAPATLREIAGQHRLAGIRMVAPTLTRDDTGWLDSPEALALWDCAATLGLPVAVILYRLNNERGRQALLDVARRFTTLPIVLDHCGLPHPSTPEKRWAEAQGHDYSIPADQDFGITRLLGEFAPLAHVHLKVTDINFDRLMEAGLDSARFVRGLADAFGARRLVWGSDVGQSPAPYGQKTARVRDAVRLLAPEEREDFLSANALRLYGGALQGAPA